MLFTVLWILWGGAFAAIEGAALLSRKPGTTLSEHVWAWFKVTDRRPTVLTWLLRAVLAAFMVWLSGHLVLHWWPT